MAKIPKKKPDAHKSGFMVRLPEAYHVLLTQLTAESRRSMTVEVQVALDLLAKSKGIAAPGSSA